MNATHSQSGPSPASQPKPRTFHNPKVLSALLGGALAVPLLCATTFTAHAAAKFYPDVVMIQYYDNIPGTALSALTSSPKFPNSPDRVMFAPIPEIPVNANNSYGARITGV